MKKLKAGVALREINPKVGVVLGGYPHVDRRNIGVHDSLHASVIAIESETTLVFVSLELVGFSKVYSDRIRDEIHQKMKVARENIFVMCTHTHSGPDCMQTLDTVNPVEHLDEDYVEYVIETVISAAEDALSHTFYAEIGIHKGVCGKEKGIGGNRKSPEDITDPELNVLSIKDKQGTLRACMASYALHPTFLHADNLYASGDYPGYIRQYLKGKEPEAVFLFAQGTSGDQSSRYFRSGQNFDEAKRAGYTLGESIYSILQDTEYSDEADIKVKTTILSNYFREIPSIKQAEENLESVNDRYEKMKRENASYPELRSVECNIFGAERTLDYAKLVKEGKQLPRVDKEHPMELSFVKINNSAIIFMQGEMFVTPGLEIKKKSKFKNTFVITLTNGGSAGYIYTKEALDDFGGYEVETSQYSPELAEHIVEQALKLMDQED